MTKKEVITYLAIRSIGNFLLLFAIFGVFATFGPALSSEFQYRIAQARGVRYQISTTANTTNNTNNPITKPTNTGTFADVLTGPTEQVLIAPDPLFSILIPKIGAASKVIPNVNPESEKDFLPVLKLGVAHAKGTVFPGLIGNTYLFAHSADNFWDVGRYNAVFYLLKDLSEGDDIVVFFESKRYNYKVTEIKILDASEVSYLVDSQTAGKQRLILQTCWPPGTAWKRLVVIAEPI